MKRKSAFLRGPQGHRARGVVLLMVLGVLALLSLLATAFVSLARLERQVSRNYVDRTQALLTAESGVELALARIQRECLGVMSPELTEWMQVLENPGAPGLLHAQKVSFNTADAPDRSGVTGSTRADDGDFYKLQVDDLSGRLNINDSNGAWNIDTDPEPDSDVLGQGDDADVLASLPRLQMIFENLVNALNPSEAPGLGANAGIALFTAREAAGGRFHGWSEVRAALVDGGSLSTAQYEELEKHLTLYAWQDPDTLRPSFKLRVSRPLDAPIPPDCEADRDVYLFSDWQTAEFALEPRCPVNVNTASRELLTALVAPLQGWYLREGPGEAQTATHYEPWYYSYTENYIGRWFAPAAFGQTVYGYYYADNTEPMITMEDATPEFVSHETRFGEACLTPRKAATPGFALDAFRAGFSRELAGRLHDYIHGVSGSPPNPIETWEEFEAVAADILEQLLPDTNTVWRGAQPAATDAGDVFWSDWTPGPEGYDLTQRYHSSGEAGVRMDYVRDFVVVAGGEEVIAPLNPVDINYWARACRRILLDLLLANFNPNSAIQDYNPDRHLHRRIDKAHLTQYSTEFIFEPTGFFAVNSVGVVEGPDKEIYASRQINAIVKVFDIARLTTQQQFMKGADATTLADYCTSTRFSASPYDTERNLSVISYPEPLLRDGDEEKYIRDSAFDGYLMHSTYAPDAGLTTANFCVHFDGRLEASVGGGSTSLAPPFYDTATVPVAGDPYDIDNPPAMFVYPQDAWWIFDLWGDFTSRAAAGWLPRDMATSYRLTRPVGTAPRETSPGVLLPDGGLSDAGRSLGWAGENNLGMPALQGRVGGMHFWMKTNFDTQNSSRIRRFFSLVGDHYQSGNYTMPKLSYDTWPWAHGLFYLPHAGFHQTENINYGYKEMFGDYWPNATGSPLRGGKWIPSCTLAYGWGWWHDSCPSVNGAGVVTPTAVEDLPNRGAGEQATHDSYYFEPHEWNFFMLGWSTGIGAPALKASFYVNGRLPTDGGINRSDTFQSTDFMYSNDNISLYKSDGYVLTSDDPPQAVSTLQTETVYARFGEPAHSLGLNCAADSTFDEIFGYRAFTDIDPQMFNHYRRDGRYYSPGVVEDTAVYLSPGWSLAELLPDRQINRATIRSVSWTCYWPEHNKRVNLATGTAENPSLASRNVNGDNVDDPTDMRDDPLVNRYSWLTADDPLSVDVGVRAGDGGETWVADTNADFGAPGSLYFTPGGGFADDLGRTLTYAGGSEVRGENGSRLELGDGDKLCFRVYFNVKPGQTLYESPVLDDITFTFAPNRPQVLQWQILS